MHVFDLNELYCTSPFLALPLDISTIALLMNPAYTGGNTLTPPHTPPHIHAPAFKAIAQLTNHTTLTYTHTYLPQHSKQGHKCLWCVKKVTQVYQSEDNSGIKTYKLRIFLTSICQTKQGYGLDLTIPPYRQNAWSCNMPQEDSNFDLNLSKCPHFDSVILYHKLALNASINTPMDHVFCYPTEDTQAWFL